MAGGDSAMRQPDSPPRWAETVLETLLPCEDRQAVTGDLREEYAESVLPKVGRWRADVWYLRQVLSLAPRRVFQEDRMRKMLLLVSVFNTACCGWLITMEMLLRHAGYVSRVAMDASISLVPLATILVILLHPGVRTERWFRLCGLPLIAIAMWAFVRNARSPHFEGFVLIISLALTLQGVLLLVFLGKEPRGFRLGEMERTQ